jgi:hypothetical protein
VNVSENEIDAGAQALRNRMQGGKKLNEWSVLSNGSKRKWRDHAACVLTAAASAREIKEHSRNQGTFEMNDNVKHHLTYLAAGSEMASRHARALPFKPPFTTAAQDELLDAERALEVALQHVREAMEIYDAKETAS